MYEGTVSFISKATGVRVTRSMSTGCAAEFKAWFNRYSADTVGNGFKVESLNEAARAEFSIGIQRVYSKY